MKRIKYQVLCERFFDEINRNVLPERATLWQEPSCCASAFVRSMPKSKPVRPLPGIPAFFEALIYTVSLADAGGPGDSYQQALTAERPAAFECWFAANLRDEDLEAAL